MRTYFTREAFIRPGAVKISDKASSAVAYVRADERGRLYAVGFQGKSVKPAFNCWFRDAAGREAYVRRFFERVRTTENYRAERKAERAAKLAKPHKLQLGHVLVCSWGYDQTNVDFYQVTGLRGARTVELRKIGAVSHENLSMQGTCTPRADAFLGEPFTRRVDEDNGVKMTSYSWARLWEGRPVRWSAYA